MKYFVMVVTLFIHGCASLNPPDSYYHAQATRAAVQATIAAQPLLRITGAFSCQQGACTIEVYDPRQQVAQIKQGKGASDVAIASMNAVAGVAKFGIGGYVATRVIREIGEKTYNVNNSGDGSLEFNNDTHETSVNGDTSTGPVTESVTTETVTNETNSQSTSIADSGNSSTQSTESNESNASYADDNSSQYSSSVDTQSSVDNSTSDSSTFAVDDSSTHSIDDNSNRTQTATDDNSTVTTNDTDNSDSSNHSDNSDNSDNSNHSDNSSHSDNSNHSDNSDNSDNSVVNNP